MKNLSKYLSVAVICISTMILGISCKKSFFTDANINTNAPSPTSIIPSVLLSTVEGSLAYNQGGDFSRYTSLLTQQTLGFSRQAQAYYQYIFTAVDFDNSWGNTYTAVMENNRTLMNLSDAKKDNAYSGISRVLMAYMLQMGVDMWGAMPYSDAFQGADKLQATYDSDAALYDTITGLLTTAISQLSNTSEDFDVPGGEDVIYGGNLTQWTKFAHAIMARLYIHQSKGNAEMASKALAEIAQSFTDNSDNARYVFFATETSAAPWYQFNQQRADINFDESTLAMMLKATNDPRFTIYINPDYTDVSEVGMGDYYGSIDAPVEFITYDELLFMKAEAILRTSGDIAAAQESYRMGIQKNMEKLGVAAADITTYLNADGNGTLPASVPDAIAKVASQEYIALYLNPEAFTLWRRTNSPSLKPISGSAIPRRFLYPQTEYSYNAANVPASATLYSPRIFWDK